MVMTYPEEESIRYHESDSDSESNDVSSSSPESDNSPFDDDRDVEDFNYFLVSPNEDDDNQYSIHDMKSVDKETRESIIDHTFLMTPEIAGNVVEVLERMFDRSVMDQDPNEVTMISELLTQFHRISESYV